MAHTAADLVYSIFLEKVTKALQSLLGLRNHFPQGWSDHRLQPFNDLARFLSLLCHPGLQIFLVLKTDLAKARRSPEDGIELLSMGDVGLLLWAAAIADDLIVFFSALLVEADGVEIEFRVLPASTTSHLVISALLVFVQAGREIPVLHILYMSNLKTYFEYKHHHSHHKY